MLASHSIPGAAISLRNKFFSSSARTLLSDWFLSTQALSVLAYINICIPRERECVCVCVRERERGIQNKLKQSATFGGFAVDFKVFTFMSRMAFDISA